MDDPARFQVKDIKCSGTGSNAVMGMIAMAPLDFSSPDNRRLSQGESHAIDLFYSLMDVSNMNDTTRPRRMQSTNPIGTFTLGNMKIIPGPSDEDILRVDPDMALEEELIRSGKCDELHLQEKLMLNKMEQKLNSWDGVVAWNDASEYGESLESKLAQHDVEIISALRAEMAQHDASEYGESLKSKLTQHDAEIVSALRAEMAQHDASEFGESLESKLTQHDAEIASALRAEMAQHVAWKENLLLFALALMMAIVIMLLVVQMKKK